MFNIEPFNAGHVAIKSLYDDGKVDEKDMHSLDKLKDDVMDDYAKGKISEQHYNNLNNTISVLYEEIYKKQIDSLNGKNSNGILLNSVKENVKDGYAKIQQLLQQKEVQLRLINKRLQKALAVEK